MRCRRADFSRIAALDAEFAFLEEPAASLPLDEATARPDAPLVGLKVVELARVLAGPWAGQTLSDLGCEVTKVESPAGDDTRQWGPPFVTRDADTSAAYFHSTNRGKKSVTVDFRTEEDAFFDGEKTYYIDGRQTELMTIPRKLKRTAQ